MQEVEIVLAGKIEGVKLLKARSVDDERAVARDPEFF